MNINYKKRFTKIVKKYQELKTYRGVGKCFNISGERVRQILNQNGIPKIQRTFIYTGKCLYCKKTFSRAYQGYKPKFCSYSCRNISQRRNPLFSDFSSSKEGREEARKYQNWYYHNILKKHPDFHKIVKERNQRQLNKVRKINDKLKSF